jgi:beta-N-acetylhexosaminidase
VKTLGQTVGGELLSVGINWNFAPVLDVDTNHNNPIIGDRAFSRDPHRVSEYAVAFARGLESVGVASAGKHFPGHGDTHLDSHLSLPSLPHNLARLRAIELVPFRAYAEAGLASIMTAHVLFSELDPEVPATMSRRALTELLRDELQFSGLIVSDDLEMRAIADHYGPEKAALGGLEAGIDTFLSCASHPVYQAACSALVDAAERGTVSLERFEDAVLRNTQFRKRWDP